MQGSPGLAISTIYPLPANVNDTNAETFANPDIYENTNQRTPDAHTPGYQKKHPRTCRHPETRQAQFSASSSGHTNTHTPEPHQKKQNEQKYPPEDAEYHPTPQSHTNAEKPPEWKHGQKGTYEYEEPPCPGIPEPKYISRLHASDIARKNLIDASPQPQKQENHPAMSA